MGPHERFTDQQLQEFYEEFREHVAKEEGMQKELREAVERNTVMVESVHANTAGILEAWQTGVGLVKFIKWASSIAAAVGIIVYTIKNGTPPH